MTFAEAHRMAVDCPGRRLDHNNALLTERFERRLAELGADPVKWSSLFCAGQLAAIGGSLGLMLARA